MKAIEKDKMPNARVKIFIFLNFGKRSLDKTVEAVKRREFAEDKRADKSPNIKIKESNFGKEKIKFKIVLSPSGNILNFFTIIKIKIAQKNFPTPAIKIPIFAFFSSFEDKTFAHISEPARWGRKVEKNSVNNKGSSIFSKVRF